jgi:hypothetical protein
MSLWGVAPLIAAALLGGGAGPHLATAPSTTAPTAAHAGASSVPSLAPAATAAAPALVQSGSGWQTTVLFDGNTQACQGVMTSFWLETGPAGPAIEGKPSHAGQTGGSGATPAAGSSCEVTVTFTGVPGVPRSAALVLDQAGASTAIPLTVSRRVTLFDYLGIPAIAGGALALAVLGLSLMMVTVYSRDGRRISLLSSDFWQRPVLASGAWTANDSWATNISTVIAIIATVLGTTTAVSAFFPGVAIDRFSIVNVIAGGIVVAAPVVFGICYARWTRRNPGVTQDATLILPADGLAVMAAVEAAAAVRLPKNSVIIDQTGRLRRLRRDTRAQLSSSALAVLSGGLTMALAEETTVTLPAGAAATLRAPATILSSGCRPLRRAAQDKPAGATLRLSPGGRVALPERTQVAFPGAGTAALALGASGASLPGRTAVALRDGTVGWVAKPVEADFPPGTAAALPPGTRVRASGGGQAELPSGAAMTLQADRPAAPGLPAGAAVTVLSGTKVMLEPGTAIMLTDATDGPAATITVSAGASISVPGGAVVSAAAPGAAVTVKPGHAVKVPPGSSIGIPAGAAMAIPGGADIAVQARDALTISGAVGALIIPGDDQAPPDPPPAGTPAARRTAKGPAPPASAAADTSVSYPARITAHGGAGITVVGAADVTLPAGTLIRAPHRRATRLAREKDLQIPQGGSVIVADLRTILIAAAVTMFGIGAELGVIGVLACVLSEASAAGRWLLLGALAVVVIGLVGYAVTAIRMLADPQPGSSTSATSGTSFTL